MSNRRRVSLAVAAVLALVIATPVLALKPDKGDDGRPDKANGPPSHAAALGLPTPVPTAAPPPAPRPTPHPHPTPGPTPDEAPVLVLPNTASTP